MTVLFRHRRSEFLISTIVLVTATWSVTAGPAAQPRDDKQCLECHSNLAMEPLTVQHMKARVTCMVCHGESSAHMAGEPRTSPPDILHGRVEIDPHCRSCHEAHRDPEAVQTFSRHWPGGRRPNGRAVQDKPVCTDCHGVHTIAKEPTELGRWRPLFNGVNLDGWIAVGEASWSVENEMIVGQQGPAGEAGDLLTIEDYGDFVLRAAFRVVWPANTGIWFRYQSPNVAYQADILEYRDPVAWSGTLYCPGKMFLAINKDPSLVNRDGWNTMEIWAKGDHIRIQLNGHLVADVHDNTTDRGKIGFQVHGGEEFQSMRVYIRDLMLLPLEGK